ncbi:creatininase family protein [candidate division KSB1 bacterium]|nr:creatininase family protein [candidate division KSB1 bacterium]RQW01031.1 MAG: creatininase family protein [candidate division KSB1 bacterium]
MEWIKITAPEIEKLRAETEVCIVPLGCLEKHSDFLPLGTDSLLAYKLACLAAEKEAAVVFPPQHYMMVASAAAQPGAIVFDAKLSMEIVERLFEEIARNGFKKIILYNFHGGNRNITPLFLQNHLARQPRDYVLYMPKFDWEVEDVIATYCHSNFGGHADEWETSLMLYLFPELVKMEQVPPRSVGQPQHRLTSLHKMDIKTPVDFYSIFPTHYAGEAEFATTETGQKAVDVITDRLAQVIKTVKQDDETLRVQQEFSSLVFHS